MRQCLTVLAIAWTVGVWTPSGAGGGADMKRHAFIVQRPQVLRSALRRRYGITNPMVAVPNADCSSVVTTTTASATRLLSRAHT